MSWVVQACMNMKAIIMPFTWKTPFKYRNSHWIGYRWYGTLLHINDSILYGVDIYAAYGEQSHDIP